MREANSVERPVEQLMPDKGDQQALIGGHLDNGTWGVELCIEGHGFVAQAGGYESAAKAKSAAARAFKSDLHTRRVRVVSDGKPTEIYEATFRPGGRAKWTPHPGNLEPGQCGLSTEVVR